MNRSIGGYEEERSKGAESIFIYGYHVKAVVGGTQVTAISQVSSGMAELNHSMVKKLKSFIEQLYSSSEEKEASKLRSVVSSTATFIQKKGWTLFQNAGSHLKKVATNPNKSEMEMKDIPHHLDVIPEPEILVLDPKAELKMKNIKSTDSLTSEIDISDVRMKPELPQRSPLLGPLQLKRVASSPILRKSTQSLNSSQTDLFNSIKEDAVENVKIPPALPPRKDPITVEGSLQSLDTV